MRQLVVRRGKPVVAEVPAPLVERGAVLVQVAFSLISTGTETAAVQRSGDSLVRQAIKDPTRIRKFTKLLSSDGISRALGEIQRRANHVTPLGYSCAGTVVAVGSDIDDLKSGDAVACAGAGLANHADLVVVPRNLTVRVPEQCSMRDAASVTVGAIALQGVRRCSPSLGENIAVIGLGLLGQITVQLLRASGCRVTAIDLDPRRVAKARDLGADHTSTGGDGLFGLVREVTNGWGADATIITAASSSDAIVQQAMEITRKKGRVVLVGDVGLHLQRSPFYEKEIDFLISCSYGPGRYDERYEIRGEDYPYAYVRWTENRNMLEYLQLVADRKVLLAPIVEQEFVIDQAAAAYEALQRDAEKPLGILLRYPDAAPKVTQVVPRRSEGPRARGGKIRLAVVGVGNFASVVHLPALRELKDEFEVAAVVSRNGLKASEAASRFDVEYAGTDIEGVLADSGIDAVLIATRHNLHAEQSMRSLVARKHVYCEKPLALDVGEVDSLIDAARENERILMVGFNRRFSPAARTMRDITAARRAPLVATYRVNAGYLPPENWVHGREGGGRIVGEACHMLDLFQFLVGAPAVAIAVETLRPQGGQFLATDNVSIAVRYRDGSLCTLIYTAMGPQSYPKEQLEVFVDGTVLVLDDFKTLRTFGPRGGSVLWQGKQDKGHANSLKAFARGVREQVWPIPEDELRAVSELIILAAEQARTGGAE